MAAFRAVLALGAVVGDTIMQMIEYRSGDIFDAPDGVLLTHACNAKGVWGTGIAREFKKRFPEDFDDYKEFCRNDPSTITGSCMITGSGRICCLITSKNYGRYVDEPSKILEQTRSAFTMLLENIDDEVEIHMPMINSGHFKVQWELTEIVLNEVLSSFNHKCVIWRID